MDLHSKKTWENYDSKAQVLQKLKAVQKLIPLDVKSILDAGCGNGIITNALDEDYDILGVDISAAALQHVTAPKMQASITQLPFEQGEFELCMCHEVLEHLQTHELDKAISELKRCASKYIMISVPYKEKLAASFAKCAECGHQFHVYGHLQSFDKKALDTAMAPDFELIRSQTLGPKQKRKPAWLNSLQQKQLGQWFYPQFELSCPNCAKQRFVHHRSLLTKASNALAWIISPRQAYWLLALYCVGEPRVSPVKSM